MNHPDGAERTGAGGTPGWAADNLAVIEEALLTADEPLSVGVLNEWHGRLIRNGDLPADMVGVLRPAQEQHSAQSRRSAWPSPATPAATCRG